VLEEEQGGILKQSSNFFAFQGMDNFLNEIKTPFPVLLEKK